MDIDDAPALARQTRAGKARHRAAGAQIIDRDIDGFGNGRALRRKDRLHDRRGFEQRTDDAAMQRRNDRVADELGIERHLEHDALGFDMRDETEPGAIGHGGNQRADIGRNALAGGTGQKLHGVRLSLRLRRASRSA